MQQQDSQHQQPQSLEQGLKTTQSSRKPNKNGKKNNKTLMRLEQPIYELKKKDQSQAEFVIRRLMDRKQVKPKIGVVERSPLFSQLEAIMPALKKANQQLKNREIPESEKIDVKLEKVQDESSSSSDDDNQNEIQMKVQNNSRRKQKKQKRGQMIDQSQQGKQSPHTNQIQLNFLRYELSEKLQSIEVKPNNQVQNPDTKKANKKLIEQL